MRVLSIVGVLCLNLLVIVGCGERTEWRVPISQTISHFIEVSYGENKFVEITRIGLFGGAGAGGLGAPQIFVDTAEQFIELVPENEAIYVWWELERFKSGANRHFLAFIENRAGIIRFTEAYRLYTPTCLQNFEFIDLINQEVVFTTPESCSDVNAKKIGRWDSSILCGVPTQLKEKQYGYEC